MILAHTLGAGGPDLELLMLSGALAILGIVFFFQKAVKPVVSVMLLIGGIGAGAAAFAVSGGDASAGAAPAGASVEIMEPQDGATVPAGKSIDIRYEVDTGELGQEAGDMHVYIDGELQSMQTSEVLTVEVPEGTHTLGVELADSNHASFDPPVIDEIEVTAEPGA